MKQYKANFNFFDRIDSPQKAYWLGFIWSDGYIAKRERLSPSGKLRTEYNLKLSVQESDAGHIQKFLNDIESNYKEGITQSQNRKLLVRHDGRDGTWRSIAFSGIPQASKVLNWLYKDSVIYLDRKYEKYLNLKFLREERDSRWANRK